MLMKWKACQDFSLVLRAGERFQLHLIGRLRACSLDFCLEVWQRAAAAVAIAADRSRHPLQAPKTRWIARGWKCYLSQHVVWHSAAVLLESSLAWMKMTDAHCSSSREKSSVLGRAFPKSKRGPIC